MLYIPVGTPKNKEIYLLVEPNNTGFTADSTEVHFNSAVELASKSSVGNNISRMLKIPLLVPVFPRPSSKANTYTHALDRDVMLEKQNPLERLDLQLISMVDDAKEKLKSYKVLPKEKIFYVWFFCLRNFYKQICLY